MADSAGAPPPSRDVAVTPFMAQYLAAKDKHPDALLFFRMGDFYELFFEDAEKAAAALDITLTRRGQHSGAPIPMAGVPWHQAEPYIARLIKAGFKVAVCEQLEDPAEAKKRGSKSIVRRDVVRVVTPGTLTEESLLDARRANILAALTRDGEGASLAWADVSTGACVVESLAWKDLAHAFAALNPAEVLVSDRLAPDVQPMADLVGAALTPMPAIKADARAGERRAKALFDVATLEAFGDFTPLEFAALGLLIDYVELTQAGLAAQLAPPQRRQLRATMAIDAATRASLEIERTQRGTRDGSLLAAIDRTVTAAGGRLMAERIAAPLTDVAAIEARLDAVAWFVESPTRRELVRKELKRAGDLARALQRLALGRGGPRDLAALRDGLLAGEAAAARADGDNAPAEIRSCIRTLGLADKVDVVALVRDLQQALAVDLPLLARDGGFIAPNHDGALDAARTLRDDSRQIIAGLQSQYAVQADQPLKIKHNNVLGYHIDATAKQAESLMRPPLNAVFIHRQTTANAVRFTTTELADLDARIARAGEEATARELALFKAFAARAADLAGPIRAAAQALAAVDVAAGAAEWASEWNGVRPEIDETRALLCEGGRHPVVEPALRKQGQGFTANDCRLDGEGKAGARLLFVTGPNMAGKSTFLRQIALMAILAQAGFYVPARRLRLGVADRVFSRVGANDDLARGRSTFMMEMVETAAILHQAGSRALVVLDEIGRGTATFDGLAIAWAASEHLHDVNGCRAVFATHYHELTVLPERLSAAANAHLRAKEFKGDLIFLHEVAPGAADRSYGVQVARLAGVPKAVVERAKGVLARLEAGKGGKSTLMAEELPLFALGGEEDNATDALREAVSALDPDSMSPRDAHEALYRLKALVHDA